MNKFARVFLPLILLLGACSTTDYISPVDTKRAAELNAELGLGYMNEGQYQRAKYKLDKAIKLDPENAHAYHYMAELYRRLKEYDKAGDYYQKALSLAPNDPNLQNNYGIYLCDIKQYDKAYKHFEKIISDPLYPARASAYENIGLCAMRQGKLKFAQGAFTSALQINKKMPKSLIELSQLSFDEGDVKKSYDYYNRYLAIAPQTPESLWIGILLENEMGHKDTVASYKILLKGKYPDSEEAKRLIRLENMGKL